MNKLNWKEFWNNQGLADNPYRQVARIGGNAEQNEALLEKIVEHIVDVLELKKEDVLLDVCCGNGLLTAQLAKHCKKIIGIDFSETLINEAKKNYPEIEFICEDAMNIQHTSTSAHQHINKINLYFSFQYFETLNDGKKVIENLLKLLSPEGKLFLGDIPDKSSFFKYYNSPRKIISFIKQLLQNKNLMGKFWSEKELQLICKQLAVKGKKLNQPKHLPYSHYRMDYLIKKIKILNYYTKPI